MKFRDRQRKLSEGEELQMRNNLRIFRQAMWRTGSHTDEEIDRLAAELEERMRRGTAR